MNKINKFGVAGIVLLVMITLAGWGFVANSAFNRIDSFKARVCVIERQTTNNRTLRENLYRSTIRKWKIARDEALVHGNSDLVNQDNLNIRINQDLLNQTLAFSNPVSALRC